MNTREQFGEYVLLKKLFEDSLGETFRAGKTGKQGLEQVVLLKVFNGRDLDAQVLWSKISDRRAVQEAVKSPNLGSGIDLSRVRGVPYVAYDYISGKSLGSLLAQSQRENSPIPTDLSLFITDRIALGLAAGYESHFQDQRLLHGFVVPNLVMLSNEGEIKVLGFDAAPGLRAGMAASAIAADVTPYLSPEALAGQPVSKTDDVYSLGAILFELLTGRRPAGGGAVLGQIDSSALAADAVSMPPELATLLKRSLGPMAQRLPDVVTWHKALSKIMVDRHYQPTTFNLAFFMHTLFRDEIERETKEIEVEKTLTVPVAQVNPAAAAKPAPAPAAEPMRQAAPTFGGYSAATSSTAEVADSGNKKGLMIGGGVAAALILGGLIYYFVGRGSTTPEPAPATSQPAATEPAPATQGTTDPEQIRAEIDRMLSERAAAMEKNLKAQYDQRLQDLQKALAEAQKNPAPAARPAGPQPATSVPTTSVPTNPPPSTEPPPPAATTPSTSSPPAGEAKPSGDAEAKGPAAEPPPSQAEPAPAEPTPAAPRPQQVRVGDLVEAGPGVVPPKLSGRIEPRYPPQAKNLNKTATVTVRALVDENGRVERVEPAGTKAGYGFDEAAQAAARNARFEPATKNGVRVKMWTFLRITFQP
ncbi:MAG: TonB family protein [Thermoanaerobaculia bacterium]